MKKIPWFQIINNLIEKWWGQLILIAIVVFIIFSPFLLGLKVNSSADATCAVFPVFGFYKEAISHRQSFFINPYFLNGYPSYASAVIGFWSPINYLFFRFLPVGFANHLLIFLYLVFGAWLTVKLFKEWGFSSTAGLISALTFILTTNAYIDLPVIANNLWLPLMLWLALLIRKHNSWRLTLFSGLIFGLGWLTAHTNWLVIGISGVFAYIIFLIFSSHKKDERWSLTLKYLSVLLISCLVALIQFIPNLTSLMVSVRNASGLYADSFAGTLNLHSLVKIILPLIYLPRFHFGTFVYYLGILPLLFAIFTFFSGPKNKTIIFWQTIALFCLLIIFPYSPLIKLLANLPVVGLLRQASRWMFLGLFAFSCLAGFGFDNWLNDTRENLKKKFYIFLKWFLIIILALVLILNTVNLFFNENILKLLYSYFDAHLYASTTHLPLEHYHSIIKEQYLGAITQFSFLSPKLLLQILMLVLGFFTLRFFWFTEKFKKMFAPAVLLLTIITLMAIYPFFIGGLPANYITTYQSATSKFIKKNPGKIFPFLQSDSEFEKLNTPYHPNRQETFLFEAELMVPNMNFYYGLKSADGHDSLMPNRFASLIALLGSSRVQGADFNGENLHDLKTFEEKINFFYQRQNLVDLLGIDYVISVFDLKEDNNFSRVHVATSTPFNIPFYIYQNKNPLPFIFLAPQVSYLVKDNLAQNLEIIKNSKNDFHQLAFIEYYNGHSNGNQIQNFFSAQKKVVFKIISQTNTKIEITYDSQAGNWLIINQSNVPGWEAKIDGIPAEIYFANFAHQGIFVPKGKHQIVVEYHYPIKYFFKNIKKMF